MRIRPLRNMDRLHKVYCNLCGSTIYRSTGRINENIKFGQNFYCSRRCQYKNQTKGQKLSCENIHCDKEVIRSPADISPHNYCSSSCAAQVNNQKFPKRGPGFKFCANSECKRRMKGERKYCSKLCISAGKRRYTSKEIIEIIQAEGQRNQRTPTKREMKGIAEVAIGLFGCWNNTLVSAGLTPNRSHSQRMYRRINTTALDGHICDSISEAIIDNWFTRKKIAHIRNVLYPDTNYRADWSIREGIFIEYFGLAQDSPRYDRAVQRKKDICHKERIKLIALYPQDIYPNICLEKKLEKYISR